MNRREVFDEERKLTPYAQAAYEASRPTTGPWEGLSVSARHAWVKVADAVLTEYDPEWIKNKGGL